MLYHLKSRQRKTTKQIKPFHLTTYILLSSPCHGSIQETAWHHTDFFSQLIVSKKPSLVHSYIWSDRSSSCFKQSVPYNQSRLRLQIHHDAARHVLASARLRKEPGWWTLGHLDAALSNWPRAKRTNIEQKDVWENLLAMTTGSQICTAKLPFTISMLHKHVCTEVYIWILATCQGLKCLKASTCKKNIRSCKVVNFIV